MRSSMLALAAMGCLIWGAADVVGQPGEKKGPMGFGGGGGGFGPGGAFGPMTPGMAKTTAWEYRILGRGPLAELGKDSFEAGLNDLGAQGWELIGIDPGYKSYIFRRPGAFKPHADTKPASEPTPKSDPRLEFRIYRMKHANANEVARILDELMRTGRQDSLRVVADQQTNQVLLKGPAQIVVDVEALLMRLDVPNDGTPPPEPSKKGRAFQKK